MFGICGASSREARGLGLLAGVFAAFVALEFTFAAPVEARGGGGFRGGAGGFGGASGAGFGGGSFQRPQGSPQGSSQGSFQRPSQGQYQGQFQGSYNQNVRTSRTNVNTGDVNVGNTVNVQGSDWGWGGGGAWGAATVGAATGAAVGAAVSSSGAPPSGTVVYALPPSCSTVEAGGATYQNCGGTYYAPTYQGSTLGYQAVPPP